MGDGSLPRGGALFHLRGFLQNETRGEVLGAPRDAAAKEPAHAAAFAALAAALRGVAEASLGLAGPGGAITRPDLLSLRLQLKAVLKQGAERYGEGEAHAELAECADRLAAAAAALAP